MDTTKAIDYLRWGKREIHPRWGTDHFLIVGATGSGKTTLINMLMKSVFGSRRRLRGMIYDPKQEVLPLLYSLVRSDRVKVLHPFDERSSAWDLAKDIDGPVSARQLATILIPHRKEPTAGESFYISAVQDIFTAVVLAFINCVPNAGVWTFRDVVLTMLYEPYLRYILAMDKTRDDKPFRIAARIRNSYMPDDLTRADPRTIFNIRASINTKIAIYEPVAAAWQHAQESGLAFSLKDWATSTCDHLLVLGNDEASRAAIDAINQAIFKRTSEILLASRELTQHERNEGQRQTWFILDEVREAGKLDGLSRLLTKGRSKGACIVMGFQDIDGMRDAYGKEVAEEICGQCNNLAILRLNSPSTADWASKAFGTRLTESHSRTQSMSGDGGLQMQQQAGEANRPWIFTSDLLYLPPTSSEDGLGGYFRSPDINPLEHKLLVRLDWHQHVESNLPKAYSPLLPDQVAFKPRPLAQSYLRPWDAEDWRRLGFAGEFHDLLASDDEADRTIQAESSPGVPRPARDPLAAHRASEYARMATEEQVYLRVMRQLRAELGLPEDGGT